MMISIKSLSTDIYKQNLSIKSVDNNKLKNRLDSAQKY